MAKRNIREGYIYLILLILTIKHLERIRHAISIKLNFVHIVRRKFCNIALQKVTKSSFGHCYILSGDI